MRRDQPDIDDDPEVLLSGRGRVLADLLGKVGTRTLQPVSRRAFCENLASDLGWSEERVWQLAAAVQDTLARLYPLVDRPPTASAIGRDWKRWKGTYPKPADVLRAAGWLDEQGREQLPPPDPEAFVKPQVGQPLLAALTEWIAHRKATPLPVLLGRAVERVPPWGRKQAERIAERMIEASQQRTHRTERRNAANLLAEDAALRVPDGGQPIVVIGPFYRFPSSPVKAPEEDEACPF